MTLSDSQISMNNYGYQDEGSHFENENKALPQCKNQCSLPDFGTDDVLGDLNIGDMLSHYKIDQRFNYNDGCFDADSSQIRPIPNVLEDLKRDEQSKQAQVSLYTQEDEPSPTSEVSHYTSPSTNN